MLVAGVDDAGRGSVIGPLGYCWNSNRREGFIKAYSARRKRFKAFSPSRRENLLLKLKG
jgi:ribonuclease HII